MRFLKGAFIFVFVACLGFVLALWAQKKTTDYRLELERIEEDLCREKSNGTSAASSEKAIGLIYLEYLKASLTGSMEDFAGTKRAVDRAIGDFGSVPELYLVRANLNFKFHRIADAKSDIERLSDPDQPPGVRLLSADIKLQEGQYEEAEQGYLRAIEEKRTWDGLARLAYLRSIMGEVDSAETLYAEALDEITAKEMRSYAWVELQRGLLDLRHGRYEEALAHYRHADKAYSGYWLVEEHIAELMGAARRFEEAVALYGELIARTGKPELEQTLGDLYFYMGQPDRAKPWHEKALAAYLESVQRGEVQYFHHLATFYADMRQDGAEAVKWARRDLELRRNFASHDALAWALYRDGRFYEAEDEMNGALASGVEDAHLFFHAAMVYLAAGRTDEGRQFLKKAAEVNPRYESFHVHR